MVEHAEFTVAATGEDVHGLMMYPGACGGVRGPPSRFPGSPDTSPAVFGAVRQAGRWGPDMRELVDPLEAPDDVDDVDDYPNEITSVHAGLWSRRPGEDFLRCAEHGLRVDEH